MPDNSTPKPASKSTFRPGSSILPAYKGASFSGCYAVAILLLPTVGKPAFNADELSKQEQVAPVSINANPVTGFGAGDPSLTYER